MRKLIHTSHSQREYTRPETDTQGYSAREEKTSTLVLHYLSLIPSHAVLVSFCCYGKHHDSKQLSLDEESIYLAYAFRSQTVIGGSQSKNLKQTPWRNVSCWFTARIMLSLLIEPKTPAWGWCCPQWAGNQDRARPSLTDTPPGPSDSGDSSSKTPLRWLDQVDNDTNKGLDPPSQVTRTLS